MSSPSGHLRWVCFFIRFGEMQHCISNGCSVVNGCRQNESPNSCWTGVVWITCGLLGCFYQLFGLSFWRHPFTTEHPLLMQCCISPNLMKKQTHLHLGHSARVFFVIFTTGFSPVTLVHREALELALALGVHEGLRQLFGDVFGPEANILTQHIIIPGLCGNHLNY